MLKVYHFRSNPANTQAEQLNQHTGSCRHIYNWTLDPKIKTYKQTGKFISRFDLNISITGLKQSIIWLDNVNSQSLQGMTAQIESAFTRLFRVKKGFAKFQSKKDQIQAFPIPQYYTVNFTANTVKLPKIRGVKSVPYRTLCGTFNGNVLNVKQCMT